MYNNRKFKTNLLRLLMFQNIWKKCIYLLLKIRFGVYCFIIIFFEKRDSFFASHSHSHCRFWTLTLPSFPCDTTVSTIETPKFLQSHIFSSFIWNNYHLMTHPSKPPHLNHLSLNLFHSFHLLFSPHFLTFFSHFLLLISAFSERYVVPKPNCRGLKFKIFPCL